MWNISLSVDDLPDLHLCLVHMLLTLLLGANSKQGSASSAPLGLHPGGLAAWAEMESLSAPFGLQLLFKQLGCCFLQELVLEHSSNKT